MTANPRPTQSSPQCLHLNLTNFFTPRLLRLLTLPTHLTATSLLYSSPAVYYSPPHPFALIHQSDTPLLVLHTFYTSATKTHLLAVHTRKKTKGTYSTLLPSHLGLPQPRQQPVSTVRPPFKDPASSAFASFECPALHSYTTCQPCDNSTQPPSLISQFDRLSLPPISRAS